MAGAPVPSMRRAPTMAKVPVASGRTWRVRSARSSISWRTPRLEEVVEGGFVCVEDELLGQAAGEGHDGGDAVGVVHPEDFAAEDEVRDGVAGEADDLAVREVRLRGRRARISSGSACGLARRNRQARRAAVGLASSASSSSAWRRAWRRSRGRRPWV